MTDIKIYNQDCLPAMKEMPDKAFDRYCQAEAAPSREIYQTLANARKVVKIEDGKDAQNN